jgi:hypothetical protein
MGTTLLQIAPIHRVYRSFPMRQATVIKAGIVIHLFRWIHCPVLTSLAFYGINLEQSVRLSGLPSRTKCLSVLLAISGRILLQAIGILRCNPFCALQYGLQKTKVLCCACLAAGGLLPEDSILKERLESFR